MGKVAPHEGREVVAVMNGYKPFATIEFTKQPHQYSMAVSLIATGMLVGAIRPTNDDPMGEVAFTRPRNRGLIAQYITLMDHGVEMLGLKGYHRAMGELFGYSPEDVEAFIDAEIDCDCDKCKGRTRQ